MGKFESIGKKIKSKPMPGERLIWDYGGDYAIVLFVSQKKSSEYIIAHMVVDFNGTIVVTKLVVDNKHIKRYNKKNMDKMFAKYHF